MHKNDYYIDEYEANYIPHTQCLDDMFNTIDIDISDCISCDAYVKMWVRKSEHRCPLPLPSNPKSCRKYKIKKNYMDNTLFISYSKNILNIGVCI